MPADPQPDQPGLSPRQYEELLQFLITWGGLTPQQARERLAGRQHPGQVTRSNCAPVTRPIYPPKTTPAPKQ